MNLMGKILRWLVPAGLLDYCLRKSGGDTAVLTFPGYRVVYDTDGHSLLEPAPEKFAVRVYFCGEDGIFLGYAPGIEAKHKINLLKDELARAESSLEDQANLEEASSP